MSGQGGSVDSGGLCLVKLGSLDERVGGALIAGRILAAGERLPGPDLAPTDGPLRRGRRAHVVERHCPAVGGEPVVELAAYRQRDRLPIDRTGEDRAVAEVGL